MTVGGDADRIGRGEMIVAPDLQRRPRGEAGDGSAAGADPDGAGAPGVDRKAQGGGKAMAGAKILVLGVAYKKNVDDVRESPALEIIWELQEWGAKVSYHDPYVKKYPDVRKGKLGLSSQPLTAQALKASDMVLILTDHDCIDYDLVGKNSKLVVDTRNAMAKVKSVKAEVVLA